MRPGSIIMSQRIKLKVARVLGGVSEAKEVQNASLAGKVMATVFCDAQGVIMLDFLGKKSTVKGAYYANLLH